VTEETRMSRVHDRRMSNASTQINPKGCCVSGRSMRDSSDGLTLRWCHGRPTGRAVATGISATRTYPVTMSCRQNRTATSAPDLAWNWAAFVHDANAAAHEPSAEALFSPIVLPAPRPYGLEATAPASNSCPSVTRSARSRAAPFTRRKNCFFSREADTWKSLALNGVIKSWNRQPACRSIQPAPEIKQRSDHRCSNSTRRVAMEHNP